jgi:hypothetical protein
MGAGASGSMTVEPLDKTIRVRTVRATTGLAASAAIPGRPSGRSRSTSCSAGEPIVDRCLGLGGWAGGQVRPQCGS